MYLLNSAVYKSDIAYGVKMVKDNNKTINYTEELFTIGQISEICNIPVKTLRYYDDIGLLPPEYVDSQNNYRYYIKKQILFLNIIKHFKTSGFSLQDIGLLLKREDLSMLENKLVERMHQVQNKIRELQYLRDKMELDIKYLKMGKDFSEYLENEGETWDRKGIEIKQIPKIPVLFTRYNCPSNPGAYIKRFSELNTLMEKYKLFRVGPLMAIFYDHYTKFDYNNADIEVCLPVAGNLDNCPCIREYGGFLGVTLLHKGQYSKMPESYGAALEWIEKKGYKYKVPVTEKYIIDTASTTLEDNYITEIIMPVEKL